MSFLLKSVCRFIIITGSGLFLFCQQPPSSLNNSASPENEIFYHIFVRSFYDSNGDRHGDLEGIIEKLDYLQELGVTSVLLTPLYSSHFYHNYFPIDFKEIDREFGTEKTYFELLEKLHERKMKLFMDMEIHYVTEDHIWYKDSFQNPSSEYSDYILYNGAGNTDPEPMIYDLTELQSYDGKVIKCCTIDLYNEEVREYFYDLFKYWIDPDGNGNFDDGVDGFRIDHIMDDLDWKGKITNLLGNFWKPLFDELREINSDVTIIGEQAEWGYGREYFNKGDMDLLFAFPLRSAIASFDKERIISTADSTYMATPEDKTQLIFIENHDMMRFATVVESHIDKLKIGAVFNILLKGVPSIYYGQEIGMTGTNGFGKYGITDGNDIPVRESFEWYKTVYGSGMALWYEETGPWWEETNLKDSDGISVEEQQSNPSSLWNYYKKLIALRKTNSAIQTGKIQFLKNNNSDVITFLRWDRSQAALIVINLNNNNEQVEVNISDLPVTFREKKIRYLFGQDEEKYSQFSEQGIIINLTSYDVKVWRIR